MQLEDWLDDLCVRFIINLPPEELASVERICFQVEEAQWFYEDFVRPLDPSLPSLPLKAFSLRIFQHCPLFSTWSAQHYTSAFAEFLAYKQRVPVRGAILLNEEMNEVVLVKGWKKGANWSFPRGKINKDENDLDCAVREVYEETGYDIQASGLVKPEKDMKYIEVTMREQHMRLYVFRGVPKDTHFEPKTRKEISKIEWYKLTDLPTLKKKNAHHDGREDNIALNANKFYMVAPFLHPLKKWIAQQKKRESRYSSSHLAAPPTTMDESATEGEPGPATYTTLQHMIASPLVPSSLPEVAAVQNQVQPQDPSAHLKELLNIGPPPPSSTPASQSIHIHNADAARSNALLSLLRNGPTADEMRANSTTPSVPAVFPPRPSQVSQLPSVRPADAVPGQQDLQPIPVRPVQIPEQQQSLLKLFGNKIQSSQHTPNLTPIASDGQTHFSHRVPQQPLAPYQKTGDPQFARESPEETKASVVPPANALPTLTHHTRALLDAFRSAPPPSTQVAQPSQPAQQIGQPQAPSDRQALLDMFKSNALTPQPKPLTESAPFVPTSHQPPVQPKAQNEATPNIQMRSSNASSLLSLFKQAPPAITSDAEQAPSEQPNAPVELAAMPMASPRPLQAVNQPDLLSTFFRKDAPKREPQARRAGETAATVDGPLNQPDFESVVKSPPQLSVDNMRRSPVPKHRTLFDPNQPKTTKILQRSDEGKRAVTAKSPRPSKSNMAAPSPKQRSRPRPEKVFQPQILRRPQSSESQDVIISSPTSFAPPVETPVEISSTPVTTIQQAPEIPRRASHQSESQKQNLLSLLTGQSGPSPGLNPSRQVSGSGTISPLSHSQVVSPLEDPISTRSRMSSLASVHSSGGVVANEGRPKTEKRQTTAGDKAFLLGYLGRIASQEGHAQQ